MTERERLRIALPKCAELQLIGEHLRACGFEIEDATAPGLHFVEDPLGCGFDFEMFALDPDDVGTYVEHGISQIGVMSTDTIRESEVNLWRPFTFNFGRYPIVLAAPRGHTLSTLTSKPILRLATPLPRFVRASFASRGVPTQVISVHDSAETAVLLGLADGWVGRLVDPEDIVNQGFRVLESMGDTFLKLVVNNAVGDRRRKAIQVFIEALEQNLPPDPPPIEIPFDLEDPV